MKNSKRFVITLFVFSVSVLHSVDANAQAYVNLPKVIESQSAAVVSLREFQETIVCQKTTTQEGSKKFAQRVKRDFSEQYPKGIPQDTERQIAEQTRARTERRRIFYAVSGDKFYFLEKPLTGNLPSPPIFMNDGKSTYVVSYKTSPNREGEIVKTAATKVAGRSGVGPILSEMGYNLHGQKIADVLRSGNFRVQGRRTDPKWKEIYQVSGTYQPRKGPVANVEFQFAPSFGNIAVLTSIHYDGYDNKSIFQVTDVKKEGKYWFASRASQSYRFAKDDTLLQEEDILLGSRKMGRPNASLFDPTLPAGGKLYDQDQNIVYKVAPDGEQYADPNYAGAKQDTNRMQTGWLFIGSLVTLLMVTVSGFIAWRKRRVSS